MKKIITAILYMGLIATSLVGCKASEEKDVQKKTMRVQDRRSNSETAAEPIEFQETKAEQESMNKWKKKTIEELLFDAMHGDAAALHVLGLLHVYGLSGFPINIEHAHKYFAASASLGFAPAIDQIRLMYLGDYLGHKHDPFLHMVYLNLISAFGHSEFVFGYHDLRKEITEKMGAGITKEIEKIATAKAIAIYETINAIQDSEDKEKTITLLLTNLGIVGEDSKFERDYWYNIFDKEEEQ